MTHISLPGNRRQPVVLFTSSSLCQERSARGVKSTSSGLQLVLCDTRDTSILIVDTYVTIGLPVSPKSRYTAVYRSSKKYRETAQVSRVSTIPSVSYHYIEQPASLRCQNERNKVTHSKALRKQSLSHQVDCPSLGSIVINEGETPRGQRTKFQTSVDLKC